MRDATSNDYQLSIGDRPLTDVPAILRQGGALVKRQVVPQVLDTGVEAEERYLANLPVQNASGSFDRTRQQVKGALIAIGDWALQEYAISRSNGCDFGSGATGFMVEELLAGKIDKPTWTQVDVHPGAVAANKSAHPASVIRVGSYLRVKETLGFDGNLDTATGLSSLDATQNVARAVEEIRSALKPGGIFLHIQDVRPGTGTGFREMAEMGVRPPFTTYELNGSGVLSPILSYEINGGQTLNVGELFRRNLGRAIIQNPGMELLGNDWVTAHRILSSTPGRLYFMNILLQGMVPSEEASAVVTVARRKS